MGLPNLGSVTITINATIATSTAPGTVVANQGTVNFRCATTTNINESPTLTDDPGVARRGRPDQLHRHLPR